jgi:excisionase family DNA binding protein
MATAKKHPAGNPVQGPKGSTGKGDRPSAEALPRLMTTKEVAATLRVPIAYVTRRLVFERRIPFFKVGRRTLFDERDVTEFLATRRVTPQD